MPPDKLATQMLSSGGPPFSQCLGTQSEQSDSGSSKPGDPLVLTSSGLGHQALQSGVSPYAPTFAGQSFERLKLNSRLQSYTQKFAAVKEILGERGGLNEQVLASERYAGQIKQLKDEEASKQWLGVHAQVLANDCFSDKYTKTELSLVSEVARNIVADQLSDFLEHPNFAGSDLHQDQELMQDIQANFEAFAAAIKEHGNHAFADKVHSIWQKFSEKTATGNTRASAGQSECSPGTIEIGEGDAEQIGGALNGLSDALPPREGL